jgi:branched-chain amino acid transport system substrate-binding protein
MFAGELSRPYARLAVVKITRFGPAAFGLGAVLLLVVLGVSLLGSDDSEPKVIRLGILLNEHESEPDTKSAIQFAAEDLMALFPGNDPPFELELDIRTTGLDPAAARTQMQALADDGIRLVIGLSSAELEAVRPIADEHDMVVISHCATASSLAIPDDDVYRMVPSDAHQGSELARLVFEGGTRTIVPLLRGDVWGDDMNKSVRDVFVKLGGAVDQGVRFNPAASSFKAEVETLAQRVDQARATAGDAVAVLFLGFGPEAPQILKEAALHPALRDIEWYGSEGSVISREIVLDPVAARFAVDTGFVHPMFADSNTPRANDIRARIEADINSDVVHYCAMAAYDSLWLAGLSAAIAGTDDTEAFENVLQALANGYEGATGRIELDDAGDRLGATYDLWAIRSNGTGFTWTKISSPDD